LARNPIDIRQTAHIERISEPNRHHRLLLTGEDLIGNDRSGDRQQRQQRYDRNGLHLVNVAAECGRKRQSLAHFQDKAGKLSWPGETGSIGAREGPA
jgi:hypothetical protein